MLSTPTNLADYKHEKAVEQLEKFISKCYSPAVFFGTAYQDYHGCFDRYEVQCDIERYERVKDIPAYVLVYLKKLS